MCHQHRIIKMPFDESYIFSKRLFFTFNVTCFILRVLDPITFDDAKENPNQSDFMAIILEDERKKRATWTMRRLNMKWNLMKTRGDILQHYFEYVNFIV